MVSLNSRFDAPNIEKLEEKGDITGLANALGYRKDATVRVAAAQSLGRVGDCHLTAVLCEALVDEENDVGNAVLVALEKFGDHTAVAPVLQMLAGRDKYPSTSVSTLASIFARIEDQEQQVQVLAMLIGGLEIKEGFARIATVESMAKILQMERGVVHNERIVRALLPLLNLVDDSWLQSKALTAMKHGVQKPVAVDLYLPIAQSVLKHQILKVAGMRSGALQILVKAIEFIDDPEILSSARASFKQYLGDHYGDVRLVCMQGLAQTGTEDDLYVIARQFIRDTQASVQKAAALALGQIGPTKSTETLLKMIDAFDSQQESKALYKTNWYGAVKALGEVREDWMVKPLIAILGDKEFFGSPSVEAAAALGNIGDKRAVEPLIRALHVNDKYMIQEAGRALLAITGQDFGEDAVRWKEWMDTFI